MNATSFRASAPAGIATVALASLCAAAGILFIDFPSLPISWPFLLLSGFFLYCAWPSLSTARLTWNRLDQFAWALLIGHTIQFLPGRDPRILAQDQSMTTLIMIQVGVWCLCLLYAGLRLLSQMRRFSNLWGPAGRYVTLFLGAASASAVYAVNPLITLAWSVKLLAIVLVACLLFDPRDPQGSCHRFIEATWLGLLLLLILFLVAATTTPEAASEVSNVGKVWRLGGSLLAATTLSAVAGILSLLALVEILAGRASRAKHVLFLVLLGMMAASMGRGGILAAGVAMVLILILFHRMRLAVGLAGVIGVVFLMVPSAADASWEILSRRQDLGEISSLTGRVPLWETVVDLISERPFFGWGYVSGSRVTLINSFRKWQAVDAHNTFLQALLTLGLVGLAIVLMLFWKVLVGGWRALRSSPDLAAPTPGSLCAVKAVSLAAFLLVEGLLAAGVCNVPAFETAILVGAAFCTDHLRWAT